jgi:putative endonuclease
MTSKGQSLGAWGEDLAAAWYEKNGYEVLTRNWRVRDGEIDLIVRRGRTFVFSEVKTRTSDTFGTPCEAVTAEKRARLRHLAALWIGSDAPCHPREIRFDVVGIVKGGDINVIEGAF